MSEGFNPCKSQGCRACCHDIQLDLTSMEIFLWFKFIDIIRLATSDHMAGKYTVDCLDYLFSVLKLGYDRYLLNLKGPCPNLSKQGDCIIHEENERPSVCKTLRFSSEQCALMQKSEFAYAQE